MNKTPNATRSLMLKCLTEGMSARATARLTGTSRGAVLRLLVEVGEFVELYSDHKLRNLPTTRVEADEQWSYVGAKQKNAKVAGHGDLWTFCALDADSKLVISWLVGSRNTENTHAFVADMASRLANRVQLTTDAWGAYLAGVRKAFDFAKCDYAILVKAYGQSGEQGPARRYSPPVCIGTSKERMIGRPDIDLVSTSYVERLNLNTRQNCRRFTRLTNAFSKSAVNHAYAVALTFFAHNFIRAHGTLTKAAGAKTTPAMASRLTDRVWTWDDVLAMMDPEKLLQ
jgi:IS1 family transposase